MFHNTECSISTKLRVLTLTMHELRPWPSIACMLPQSHCGDKDDGMKLGLLIILYMFMANGMVFRDSWPDLNYLFQKVIRYQHHHDNYQ